MSNMRHDRMIAADSLARIADYLDCSVDYLLGRTDDPHRGISWFVKDKPRKPCYFFLIHKITRTARRNAGGP